MGYKNVPKQGAIPPYEMQDIVLEAIRGTGLESRIVDAEGKNCSRTVNSDGTTHLRKFDEDTRDLKVQLVRRVISRYDMPVATVSFAYNPDVGNLYVEQGALYTLFGRGCFEGLVGRLEKGISRYHAQQKKDV